MLKSCRLWEEDNTMFPLPPTSEGTDSIFGYSLLKQFVTKRNDKYDANEIN